jgi:hypothetical protein
MYSLGQDATGSNLTGISDTSSGNTIQNIYDQIKNRPSINWLGIDTSPNGVAQAKKPFIDFSRWGSIIVGLILFTAGVFMLTRQTEIKLVNK